MTTVEPIKSLNELKKIKKVLAKNERNLLLFTLGINSGLRVSDILALNVRDVKGKTHIRLVEKKTGKFKKVPLNNKVRTLIDSYTKNRNLDEPLFMTIFKNRMYRVAAYDIIKSACKKANITTKVGTHTMRKTFGYHHYKKFKDIAMLQKIFNHSSQTVTLRYIGIEQDQIEESYSKFML